MKSQRGWGKITYRNFSTDPEINIFIHHISGEITNLRNIEDANDSLPSRLTIAGESIGRGKLTLKGQLNILRPIPDMKLATKLEHVDLPALNDYFKAFAALDVEQGDFDLYSELAIENGRVNGYAKPIAQNISLIDLQRDSNPIKFIWESIASVVLEIFTNQPKDQLATEIPLHGRIDHVETSAWAALAGIVRNAFVEAFEKGFGERQKPQLRHAVLM